MGWPELWRTERVGAVPSPTRLFVWSGGGFPGLDVHMGYWAALEEEGITATANSGTSAGAIMAVGNSLGWSSAEAEEIVLGLRNAELARPRWAWKVRAPWIDHAMDVRPIREMIERLFPADFEGLKKPTWVWTTNWSTGRPWYFNRGARLREAVLASMSIPGVFPEVTIDGYTYTDGGLSINLPLPLRGTVIREVWREFDEVWLLVASRPLALKKYSGGILGDLQRAADLFGAAQAQRVEIEVEAARADGMPCPTVRWLQAPVEPADGPLRFDHALIEEVRRWTAERLAEEAGGGEGEATTKDPKSTKGEEGERELRNTRMTRKGRGPAAPVAAEPLGLRRARGEG